MLTCGGGGSRRANGTRGRWFPGLMAWPTGRAFNEGTAVGKMAATLGPSGWWQRWRQRLSARNGSRMLLLLLLMGSGQGPRQVGAGQTFEYLKREHSLSKPYQGEAPGARWSCTGRASESELSGSDRGWPKARGPKETAGGGRAHGDSRSVWEPRVQRAGVSSPCPPFWKFPAGRSRARMQLALGLDKGELGVGPQECRRG